MCNYKASRIMTFFIKLFRCPVSGFEENNVFGVILIPVYFLLCLPVSSSCVNRPDAGSIMTSIKEQSSIPQGEPSQINLPGEETMKPRLQMQAGVKVKVTIFRFSGNIVFDEKRLSTLVASYVGRELTIVELNRAALSVEDYYHKNGFVMARAYLPAQEIKNGVVEIAILEGQRDNVIIDKYQEKRSPAPILKVP
ncbi:MAG: hypothetical protein CSYNP_02476 [Syntrophus sp. SKADARSKE-3]|nr:hypothetical protein [Syntrophus sp. SKADARSKE-3]